MQSPYSYTMQQLDLLAKLVNDANPTLPIPLTATNMRVSGNPATQTPPNGTVLDTNVLIAPNDPSYFGSRRLQYRRIDLGKLFKNMTPVKLSSYAASTLSNAQLLAELNSRYGLALTSADYASTGFASNTQYTLTVATTSLCYQGSFTFIWTKPKRPLTDLMPVSPALLLSFRGYQGGNSTYGSRKPQGEYMFYGLDCSYFKNFFTSITNASTFTPTAGTDAASIVQVLAGLLPGLGLNTGDQATPGGLSGVTVYKYTLPQASIPEANSDKFANVFVLQSTNASWFQGRILLHYN